MMAKHVLTFYLLLIAVLVVAGKRNNLASFKVPGMPGRLVQRYSLIAPCAKNFSSHARITAASLTDAGPTKGIFLNMDVTYFRQVERVMETIVRISNCPDQTLGSCELFQTWRFHGDSCKLWEQKNTLWTPMYESFSPKARCPLQKRTYSLRNGSMDISLAERLPYPLEKYYWRYVTELYDPELFLCWEIGGRYMRVRS